MNALLEIAVALLAVDFVSGLVHWAEDTFGAESTPLVGRWIVRPNVRHHREPTAFVHLGWLASSWDLALASASLVVLALAGGWFGPGVALVALLGANANQLHKHAHAPGRAPLLVRLGWRLGLLQTPAQHARHHRGAKNQAYCVVTPWLNPVLDRLRFWRGLERILVPLFGAPRREDLREAHAPRTGRAGARERHNPRPRDGRPHGPNTRRDPPCRTRSSSPSLPSSRPSPHTGKATAPPPGPRTRSTS